MKNIITLLIACSMATIVSAQALTFHSYEAKTILGDTINLSQYYGKKVMVVNTASFCGFTPQFEDLENLYLQYSAYNFEIIGFPCNDFSNQDPHSDSVILDFCTDNYNVTFQMMSKVEVVTGDTAPVYKWLQRGDLNGVSNAQVAWNFNKFLIDEAGHWVRHFGSATLPGDTAITNWILSPSVISGIAKNEKADLMKITSGNMVSSNLDLYVSGGDSKNMIIQLFSYTGQLMGEVFNGTLSGTQLISYSVQDLPAGMYLLKASSGAASQTERIAIVK
jgi:glutathione peroxidase